MIKRTNNLQKQKENFFSRYWLFLLILLLAIVIFIVFRKFTAFVVFPGQPEAPPLPPSEEICLSFNYSSWSACSKAGTQIRSVVSKSPANCVGGGPVLSKNCTYIPFCVENATQACDSVLNGRVSGFKAVCFNETWVARNNCTLTCNSRYIRNVDRCDLITSGNNTNSSSITLQASNRSVIVKDRENRTLVRIENASVGSLGNPRVIASNTSYPREYLIVNNLSLSSNMTKTIYLEKKNQSSNSVCVEDSEGLESVADILDACVMVKCPGSYQNYNCSIQNNVLSVSGLRHSGVVEGYMYCGDNICAADESCSSCSSDCGSCSSQPSGSGTGGGGSGGSSGGTTRRNATTAPSNAGNLGTNTGSGDVGVGNNNVGLGDNGEFGEEGDKKLSSKLVLILIIVGFIILISVLFVIIAFIKKKQENSQIGQSQIIVPGS